MRNNNDLAKLINKYLTQSEKKNIFFDKEKILNVKEIKIYANTLAKSLYILSLKKKKKLGNWNFFREKCFLFNKYFCLLVGGCYSCSIKQKLAKKSS